jgi:O-antigen/teichoic acid export membrane protein
MPRPVTRLKTAVTEMLRLGGAESRIARNSAVLLIAESVSRGLSLLAGIVLYRYLGPEGSGTLKFVVNYGTLFSIIAEMGLTRAAIRQIAREDRDAAARTLGHLAALRLAFGALCVGAVWLSLATPLGARLDAQTRLLVVLWSFSVLFQALRRNSEAVFQGFERMHYHALFLVLNRAFSLCGILLLVLGKMGITAVFVVYVLADLLDAAAAALLVRNSVIRPVWRMDPAAKLTLLAAGIPFGLQIFAGQIYYYIDSVLLRFLYPVAADAVEREIGWYGSAYTVVLTLLFIPLSVCNGIFPAMSRAHRTDRRRLGSLFSFGFNLLLLTGLPIAVAFFLLRVEVIRVLYGGQYAAAVPMLAVIIWTLPLSFVAAPMGSVLAATDRQKLVTVGAFLNAVVNIALNLRLIPANGGMGAALATVLTEALGVVVMVSCVMVYHRDLVDHRSALRIAAFHAVAAGICLAADGTPIWVRIAALAAYGAVVAVWARRMMQARRRAEAVSPESVA